MYIDTYIYLQSVEINITINKKDSRNKSIPLIQYNDNKKIQNKI